ncbi:hypothetical protein T439DRAFT_325571 [Meredithblackwellia eburnea MCA 4105]
MKLLRTVNTTSKLASSINRRLLSTRPPHPLASKVTPSGPVPVARPSARSGFKNQRFSPLTGVLLATLVGTTTYLFGVQSTRTEGGGAARLKERDPTPSDFKKAMEEVKGVLPDDCYTQDKDTLWEFGATPWTYHDPRGLPGAILYPRSTADVVEIVKIASKHAIPIVPFSGGTSLEGHTLPPVWDSNEEEKETRAKLAKGEKLGKDDLVPGLAFVLSFSENMGEIIKINPDDLDCIVQPGISYDALNMTLKEEGIPLFFPVDPAPGAQIGGMIGTGASGTNAVRYGTMRDNVINLTVVLPNGEVIKTRARAKKSSAGPDLGKLFVGSEGTLGIVTEATLKLSPKLPYQVAVSSFPTIQDAANAVRDIVQQGIGVSCLELLDDVMVKAVNQKNRESKGARIWEEKPSLFIKFSGTEGQMKSDQEKTKTIAKSNKGSGFAFSRNESEAEDIWTSRKVALWSALDYVPGSRCWTTDVCVPISYLPALVAETKADTDEQGIVAPIVGHAGDGNFHALLLYSNDDEFKKVEGLVHRMVERAQRMEGTCTGEHGVGLGKMHHLEDELGKGTVDLLRNIKKTIDPQNIMNPGKLIPGLGGCSHGHGH